MNRRSFMKISGVALAIASVGNVTAKTLEVLHMPKVAELVSGRTAYTYIKLGDGFEFLCPRKFDNIQMAIKFYSHSIYDLKEECWKKHRGEEFYENFPAPNMSNLPVLGYPELAEIGYMIHLSEEDRGLINYRFDFVTMKKKIIAYRRANGLEIY